MPRAGPTAAGVLALGLFGPASATSEPEPRQPPVVTPGRFVPAPPPPGAVILFDGTDLSAWRSVRDGGAAGWTVSEGLVTVAKGAGNIETRRRFGSYRLHVEWRIPAGITGVGQARGNSGVFLASTGPGDEGYELQILDSYRNRTYPDGQAGSLYKQAAPRANPARPPGEWQSFDITWVAPRFDGAGKLTRPARATVRMNGVLVQDRARLAGPTLHSGTPSYVAHGRAAIKLQDHGDPSAPISFRNIWLRESND